MSKEQAHPQISQLARPNEGVTDGHWTQSFSSFPCITKLGGMIERPGRHLEEEEEVEYGRREIKRY